MINSAPQNSLTGSPASPNRPEVPRWVWVLFIVLIAVIISGLAGLLSFAAGNNVPAAILTGGGAFAGTVALLLAIAHFASAE
jgi:ABC-type transport system involved in multi-copper enzyme maturation permease subunit